MAEVSPVEAVTAPLSRSCADAVTFSNFQRASGVAPVKASTLCCLIQSATSGGIIKGAASVLGMTSLKRCGANAGTQVVMATGNAACTNARPTSAGLNTLLPKPPNSALPMAMATKPATTPIHKGNDGGSVSASTRPVMVALQSLSVLGCAAARLKKRSVARQVAVTVSIRASADRPYCHTAKPQIGSSDSTTCFMMVGTLRSLTWCGDVLSSMLMLPPFRD